MTVEEHQLVGALAEMAMPSDSTDRRFTDALLRMNVIGERQAARLRRLVDRYGYALPGDR